MHDGRKEKDEEVEKGGEEGGKGGGDEKMMKRLHTSAEGSNLQVSYESSGTSAHPYLAEYSFCTLLFSHLLHVRSGPKTEKLKGFEIG